MSGVRYVLSVLLYLAALPWSSVAAFVIPLWTRPMQHKLPGGYSWGGWFGTFDNPPQGDEGFVAKRAPYPNVLTGWKGYWNRVEWMRRNRLYGLKRRLSYLRKEDTRISLKGNPDISDKHKESGYLHVSARSAGKLKAFEFYGVFPYTKNRCIRIRLGWKIKGRKFREPGDIAPLVFTINPFDGYGS